MKKVLVGMSGGVDSSVTAYLLQKEGYEVIGVYMKLHHLIPNYHENNIAAAQKVADFLDIKLHILDIEDKFKQNVYDYFVNTYIDGLTPNPCVKCNRTIKFGALFEFCQSIGADFLATGHYAKTDGKFIYEADDKSKDQSYFLAQVNKDVLQYLIFPMSKYNKSDILQIAKKIPAIEKKTIEKESQEICFVQGEYTDIISKHTNIDIPGKTLDPQGNIIGHHKGYMHYTIGKRRGFYVHGAHEPHYVKELNPKNNTIVVTNKDDLAINEVHIDTINLFVDKKDLACSVKFRYRSFAVACEIFFKDDIAIIQLVKPVYAVAVGQVAVFYDKDKILGSGYITKTFKTITNKLGK